MSDIPNKIEMDHPRNGYEIVSHGGIGNSDRGYNLTGSCHELSIYFSGEVFRILIDTGAFQSSRAVDRSLEDILERVQAVIWTHPHMDHIGDALKHTKTQSGPSILLTSPETLEAMAVALKDKINIEQRNYDTEKNGFDTRVKKTLKPALKSVRAFEQGEPIKRDKKGNRVLTTQETLEKNSQYQVYRQLLAKNGIDPNDPNWYKKLNHPLKPEFELQDVENLIESIETLKVQDGWRILVPGKIAVSFYNAGHIIGSVSPLFRITDEEKKNHYVLFSGDLGSYQGDLHPNGFATPPNNLPIETVMIESTYGGTVREEWEQSMQKYEQRLGKDIRKYDTIIHACFALDRLQNILYRVIDMRRRGVIPASIPIFVDSKMGAEYIPHYIDQAKAKHNKGIDPKQRVLREYVGEDRLRRAAETLDSYADSIDPKNGEYIILNQDNREELLATHPGKKIIITASGMAEGGPIMEYLQRYGPDSKASFYFPGFLVPETRGYDLAVSSRPGGKKKLITVDDTEVAIRAKMEQIAGFSGHGDERDLLMWLRALKFRKDSSIIVVHGDVNGSSLAFKHTLERRGFAEKNITVPDLGDVYRVDFDAGKQK